MIKKIRDLFKSTKVRELEHHVRVLEAELLKKQEDINKTNAYWKRKLHAAKAKPV
jgi:hypothetical protein